MDSMDIFNKTELPSIKKFYSSLQMKHISENEYKHARKVLEMFNIKTLGEYHDLYVQADVAQLSDVFESFRSACLEEYQLDPAYFVSTPSLALEAMLKITKVQIELFTDIDILLMTEKGIRGGLTQVIGKDGIANNKYLPDNDSSKKSTYLQYLDANNLYGYAMNTKLSLNGYKVAYTAIFTDEFIKNYNHNDDKGYLLEVDVVYPEELRIVHRDLPFLLKKRSKRCKEYEYKVSNEVQKANRKVYKTFNITHEPKNKLIATVQDKDKYAINISTLKQTLKHRLKLEKFYRAIEFNQSDWLKPYIDKNTGLRKKAKNESEKDFFKLMNNSVFGKMIENVRKRREIKLIVTEERRKKLVSEPNYASCTTFLDHLMAIETRRTNVLMDKPILVGQAILDKSKELMYNFCYEYLKPKYKDKINLLYMDTDRFVLEVETDYCFKDTKDDLKECFDTSNYHKDMVLPNEYRKNGSVNKKVIGKMKIEIGKGYMSDFIAISPKVYAYKQIQDDGTVTEDKKARGTSNDRFDHYKNCLFNNEVVKCTQYRIKSIPRCVDTVQINKIALKNNDGK